MTQTPRLAKWTIFLAATALVVYLCAVILRPFVNIIAWAIVLTITFNPVHQYFTRRTGRPGLSALMSSVLVIRPPMTTVANGFCTSAPVPVASPISCFTNVSITKPFSRRLSSFGRAGRSSFVAGNRS